MPVGFLYLLKTMAFNLVRSPQASSSFKQNSFSQCLASVGHPENVLYMKCKGKVHILGQIRNGRDRESLKENVCNVIKRMGIKNCFKREEINHTDFRDKFSG